MGNFTFNKETLFNPEKFNDEWLKSRQNILSKNENEFKLKNSFNKQIRRMYGLGIEQKDLGVNKNGKDILGSYFPIRRTIAIDDSLPMDSPKAFSTYVHERTHAGMGLFQGLSPQNRKIKQIVGDKWNEEIYPTLQEVRFNFKINPEFKFETQDVEHLIKASETNSDLNGFLKSFTTDELKEMLNEVAQNNTGKTNVTSAQPGAKLLIPHKDYLGIPYRQDGDYNYFEVHPENVPSNPGEHWTSRNPITGKLLKSETHPTFDLMVKGEKEADMDVYRGLNGELYSYPKDKFVPLYLKHFNYGHVK